MSDHYQWQRDSDTISTDPAQLDVEMIHQFLTTSYWVPGIERRTVEISIENSLCFGLYHETKQIGFARIVPDYARFAYLLDVFVVEQVRAQGLGKWLIACILECPALDLLPSIGLATRDAHSFYEAFGWERLSSADHLMRLTRIPRPTPDV